MKTVSAKDYESEVLKHPEPVAVTFGWSGCGPCRTQGKILDEWAKADGVKVVKVDITEDPDIATQYNINTVPTTVFVAGGLPKGQYTGVANLKTLREFYQTAKA